MTHIARIELYHVRVPLPATFRPSWIPGYPQNENRFDVIRVITGEGVEGWSAAGWLDLRRTGGQLPGWPQPGRLRRHGWQRGRVGGRWGTRRQPRGAWRQLAQPAQRRSRRSAVIPRGDLPRFRPGLPLRQG